MRVNNNDVKKTLNHAFEIAKGDVEHKCMCEDLVDFVLDNTHLTYKYILVTALAAKATEEWVNPLCLQAKSTLDGAYDARTICHGVIVKFEKSQLGKALGGSNEPFLNKPARFTELSKSNAVRRGRDQEILHKLCDDLPKIQSSEDAFGGLVYALKKLLIVKEQKAALTAFSIDDTDNSNANLYKFINNLLDRNYEGEILTLVVAGLYEQFMKCHNEYLVEVHPVNESGASRKEISDLDVYLSGELYISNELKDKTFSDHDMEHAADKVMEAGKMQMNFIMGRHGGCSNEVIQKCMDTYLKKNFIINVIPIDFFVPTMINLIADIDSEEFLKYILRTARDTKFKETTIAYIQEVAKEYFDIKQQGQ